MNFDEVTAKFPPPFYVKCPVCLDVLRNPRILHCSHTVCRVCLETLIRFSTKRPPQNAPGSVVSCPVCRKEMVIISADKMPHNRGLSDAISDWRIRMMAGRRQWFRSALARCDDHNSTASCANLWCTTCERTICERCHCDGNHRDHRVDPIENFDAFTSHRADVLNECFAAYERLPDISLQIWAFTKKHRDILEQYINLGSTVDAQEAYAHRLISEKFKMAREKVKRFVQETTAPLAHHRSSGLQTLNIVHTFLTNAKALMKKDPSNLREYSEAVVQAMDHFVTTCEKLNFQESQDLNRVMTAPFNQLVFEVNRVGSPLNSRTIRDLRAALNNVGRRRNSQGPVSPRGSHSPRNSPRSSPRRPPTNSYAQVNRGQQSIPLNLSGGRREHRIPLEVTLQVANTSQQQSQISDALPNQPAVPENRPANSAVPDTQGIPLPGQGGRNRHEQMLQIVHALRDTLTGRNTNSTIPSPAYQSFSDLASRNPAEETQAPAGPSSPDENPLAVSETEPSPPASQNLLPQVQNAVGPGWDPIIPADPNHGPRPFIARADHQGVDMDFRQMLDSLPPHDLSSRDVQMGSPAGSTNQQPPWRDHFPSAYHDHGLYGRAPPPIFRVVPYNNFSADPSGTEDPSHEDLNNNNGNRPDHDLDYHYYFDHHSFARLRRSYNAQWYYDCPPFGEMWRDNPYNRISHNMQRHEQLPSVYTPVNTLQRGQPSSQGRRRPIRGRNDGGSSSSVDVSSEVTSNTDTETDHDIPVTDV